VEPARIDLTDAAYWADPHAVLRAARARHAVALATSGEPIVLRYADVEKLAGDARVASNARAFVERNVESGPLVEWWRRMLTNQNGPEHLRLRGLVSRAFTPRSVDRKRARIRELTREIAGRHLDAGEMDVLHDLAHELPIRLICDVLGVPEADHADVSRWSTWLGRALSSVITPEVRAEGEEAVAELSRYALELIAERRAAPRDDLLSALLHAADESDDPFDDEDLVVLVINLVFGGHDSSRSMITAALALLAQHPDQQEQLRRDPGLAAPAGEEVLRYEPIVGQMARQALEDLEVGGVRVRAGQTFLLSILAANRDPDIFPDPDRFDIARSSPRSFSFGWGPHHCLGAALARAEIQEVVPVFLGLTRDLELLEPPRWVPFANLRRIERLPVRFRAA
jgi:hypothetical protein